jgi:photosystem II stability/assembly factor-like uncharacterized protein
LGPHPELISNTSLAVNPNAEGDVWVADSHSIFHSLDGGATWAKLNVMGSKWLASASFFMACGTNVIPKPIWETRKN